MAQVTREQTATTKTAGAGRWVIRVALISLILQVAAIGLLHTYRFRTTDNNFAFGWEMGCIGRALASGRGFSDPFCMNAGPTAWEPPVYPCLIGGVFKLFGIYTHASAWVLLALNSLFSSLTCIPVYYIARRIFGERVARYACWTWGLLPYTWYWSIHWVWDTTLSPLLLTLILLIALRLAEGKSGWIVFGLLWGGVTLANPSITAFLPFCGIWVWRRRHARSIPSLGGVSRAAAVFLLCVTPWLIRNYSVFGTFIFVRDNLAQELRLGNGPGATGTSEVSLMPNRNPAEMEALRVLGELPYLERQKLAALTFIRENPGRFWILSAKRFYYYWAGAPKPDDALWAGILRTTMFLTSSLLSMGGLILALRRNRSDARLFALLMFSYPIVYYFVYPHARYRHPLEPVMVITMVFLISEAMTAIRIRRRTVGET
jgi:4-amino-4-deoxy-L-arabinose transferase-like glycosyltransferase